MFSKIEQKRKLGKQIEILKIEKKHLQSSTISTQEQSVFLVPETIA